MREEEEGSLVGFAGMLMSWLSCWGPCWRRSFPWRSILLQPRMLRGHWRAPAISASKFADASFQRSGAAAESWAADVARRGSSLSMRESGARSAPLRRSATASWVLSEGYAAALVVPVQVKPKGALRQKNQLQILVVHSSTVQACLSALPCAGRGRSSLL